MPGKSVKQSDDEGVVRVEETEARVELAAGADEQASTNGRAEQSVDSELEEHDGELLTGEDTSSEEAVASPEAQYEQNGNATRAVGPLEEASSALQQNASEASLSEATPASASSIVETGEPTGMDVFPLEINHDIEVTPEEALATGWPGASSFADEQAGTSAFPIEIAHERSDMSEEAIAPGWNGEASNEIIGAIELAPQDLSPFQQGPEESNGTVELASHGMPIGPGSEEVIGAVELASRDKTPSEQPAEIIGPIELAHFFAETTADPASIVEQTPTAAVETATPTYVTERRHLVKSAALVSIGNLGSSLLGMVRQIVVTSWGTGIAGPFNAALAPVNNFYQLLVNGSTDGALIPVFNDYAAPERRHEMRRVVFTVVNLILIISVVASIGYLLISPWFVNLLVDGYTGPDRTLTLQYSQVIFFSLVVLGPFAVLLAALFSLKTFGWPAFATASYHAGIILGALAFALIGNKVWGPIMLPIGLLVGALGQIVLLLPGIRHRKLYYMFVLDLRHPALKRIYRLYWPIAVSYVFSMALVFLDLYLQSNTPQHAAATTAMATATTLIQFPIGLVAQALSVAVLPTLSEHAREGNTDRFKDALLLGIRLGLLLMIPAMTGLLVLRTPIVYVIFAHHNYGLGDANLSALALQNYAYQLPFVAIDQLLIAAFYARKNTKTPVIIGIVSMLFYLVVALPFYRTIGTAALAFANTVQNSSHAVILLILLRMSIGSLHIRRTIPAVLKICVAAVMMGVVAWGAMILLSYVPFFSLAHLIGQLLTVIVAGGLAVAVYIGGILLFKVEEISLVKRAVMAKLGRK
jgi:putative peptidoglycan lipid II flippase